MNALPIKPTDSELSILRILWDHGPATVRTVAEELGRERNEETGYTTALKLLQIMHEKGLVTREEAGRSHLYSSAHSPDQIRGLVLRQVADKLFRGATADLAMHALTVQPATDDEMQRIRDLLDELESKETLE